MSAFGQEKVMGMVLAASNYGEYDKRLVLLTREYGKITVFAKGARKPSSPLLGCSQAFVFGEFTVFRGRTSYTLNSAEVTNYFEELRDDIEAMYYGFYFCEFAEYLTRENVPANDMLLLLYQSLRVLIQKVLPFELVRAVFELKILAYNGEAFYTRGCVRCQKQEDSLLTYSVTAGGFVCESCKTLYPDVSSFRAGTARAVRHILGAGVKNVFDFNVSPEILEELKTFAEAYCKTYVAHSFHSLPFLEMFSAPILVP